MFKEFFNKLKGENNEISPEVLKERVLQEMDIILEDIKKGSWVDVRNDLCFEDLADTEVVKMFSQEEKNKLNNTLNQVEDVFMAAVSRQEVREDLIEEIKNGIKKLRSVL